MPTTIGVCQVKRANHNYINCYSVCAQLILPFCCSQACMVQLLLAVQTVMSNSHVIDVKHVSSM